ncbi:MAG: hypothetical protein IKF93_06915 [Lachnospiraceae bacterium]|nr:hypothetical protein [Lachnospiraceae bacterium]
MSVLIKGMEMPKSCFYCPFRRKINPDDIQCLVTRDVFEETFAGTIEMRKRGFCPLIEMPPHGRLIDAKYVRDKIIQKWMYKADDSHMYKRGMEDAYEVIRNAPTIIPADKDGET